MKLSGFILDNIEPIVQEWESFARTLEVPGKLLDSEALRDHAEIMLREFAADLLTEQTPEQQIDKSKGHAPPGDDTAAHSHAITRLTSGFTLDQVVSEFRALRASVTRLWMREVSTYSASQIADLIRFNEAIDQALARSIESYAKAVQVSRDIFLGILGHDLRTPLSAILMGADMLLGTESLGARPTKIASRIYTSVRRASQIFEDLLDFTRSQLGPGIPVTRSQVDIAKLCERIVDECRTVHPEADIVFTSVNSAIGHFDSSRLEQVFSNLIGNAVQHGDGHTAVTVTLAISEGELQFSVHNKGAAIPNDILPTLFNPMVRSSPEGSCNQGPFASLGLGLFISDQIATAHKGRIEVTSDTESGTEFIVRLPHDVCDPITS
ncbi:sensor histidine kinase [Pseudomonas syringae group genomosp. 3]|uniref:histidine kinase n=1 Tax=Pseudomonas syringae pv. viburni TaxID=251703 RepID=A0A0Q0G609_9PSED|nr:sensor histidine kinase [Pseudomonas syringae group genomosp. 3]KPZ08661.1 ATP-binding region, ATPase-like:Histidine kinase A, N-terminal [Pseudomonas syringae pv. viburni]